MEHPLRHQTRFPGHLGRPSSPPPSNTASESENETEGIESRLLNALNRGPAVTLRLDLINKCNLRCIMCPRSDASFRSAQVRLITPETFADIFSELSPQISHVMLSTAAEPLFSRHFLEILKIVSMPPPFRWIGLCTNAMLMDGRVSSQLIERCVNTVMLSIDGVARSTVENIRKGSSFKQIIQNIATLRDLKNISGSRYPLMTSNYVMMHSNIQEAPAFVAMAKELGIESIDFRHVVPTPYWHQDSEELRHNQDEYNAIYPYVLEASHKHEIHVILPRPFPVGTSRSGKPAAYNSIDLDDFERVISEHRPTTASIPTPVDFPGNIPAPSSVQKAFPNVYCHRPFTDIQLHDDASVMPCSWHRKILGNLNASTSLREIFFGKAYARLRANMFLPDGDAGCEGCLEKAWQEDRVDSSSAPPDDSDQEET